MNKYIKGLCLLFFIIYVAILAYMMLFSFSRLPREGYSYNLVPFTTIKTFMNFKHFNTDIWVINLIGNVGVFIPLGILLPILLRYKWFTSYIVFLCIIAVLELAQLLTRRGSLDIDDFILNSVGFFIGYLLYKLVRSYYHKKKRLK